MNQIERYLKYLNLTISCLLFLVYSGISQPNQVKVEESFENLKNIEIRREISYFTIYGSKLNQTDITNKNIIEISLSTCNDTIAIFEKGNFIRIDKLIDIFVSAFDTSKHKLIFENNKLTSIDGKKYWGINDHVLPRNEIKAIRILHGKINIKIPQESYADLLVPNICSCISKKNKCQSSFKVFQTLDHKRLYIYMHDNISKSKYEVCWIVEDNKYLMRIINPVD